MKSKLSTETAAITNLTLPLSALMTIAIVLGVIAITSVRCGEGSLQVKVSGFEFNLNIKEICDISSGKGSGSGGETTPTTPEKQSD